MNKKKLISFENEIAKLFNEAKIRAPIHLYSNNETFLIKFFKKIKKNDWVFCSWRSHYQCLLKYVPPQELKKRNYRWKINIFMLFKTKNILISHSWWNITNSGWHGTFFKKKKKTKIKFIVLLVI